MEQTINLDNNATTALDPHLYSLFHEIFENCQGNSSSSHHLGRKSRSKLVEARSVFATAFKVHSKELTFTSGGTEAINLFLRGFLKNHEAAHVISSSTEHAAVYLTLKDLQKKGIEVSFLNPGFYGAVTPEAVEAAIRPNTKLIALMAVNNETGVKTDIEAIAKIAEKKKITFFVDGVAWLGKEQISIPAGVTAIACSGHKIHAPTGIGLLWVRTGTTVHPQMTGGFQDGGIRSGTENVVGAVLFSHAFQLMNQNLKKNSETMAQQRDHFEKRLISAFPFIQVNGTGPRVCNVSNLAIIGLEGELLQMALDQAGVCTSLGSACSTGVIEPSRVLLNMGYSRDRAASSLRISLSRLTTEEEISKSIDIFISIINRLKNKNLLL